MARPSPDHRRVSAPFGRIGHRLGWRWAFWWTLPIPYHPYLFHTIVVGFTAWLFYLLAGGDRIAWTSPLWAALVLGILLSVPFLQWFLLAFRLQLIQAAMVPAAMMLLGIAASLGQEPPWLVALPILYFACHAAAVIRSRTLLARIRAEVAAVERDRRAEGGLPPIVLEGFYHSRAQALMETLSVPFLYSECNGERRLHIRLDPHEEQLARRLAALAALPRAPVLLHGKRTIALASIQIGDLPEHAARVRVVRWPGRKKRLVGALNAVELVAPDGRLRRTYDGRAAAISWFPGFMFFFYLRLGSQAAYRFEAGVVRGKQHILGQLRGDEPPAIALLETLREPALPTPAYPDRQLVAAAIDGANEARIAQDLQSLGRLLADPASWQENKLSALLAWPDRYADRAEELIDGFQTAREAKRLMAGITLGRLIARLPPGDFARVGHLLLDLLGDPDMAEEQPLPRSIRLAHIDQMPFRGFGLLVQVPDLYQRLGELGAPSLPLIEELGRRYGWRRPLLEAYRAVTGHGPPRR